MLQVGLDQVASIPALLSRLRDGRVGLLAHPASVDHNLVHISRVLESLDIRPRRVFGPEHGYGGEAQDMIGVPDAIDPRSGAQIVSLYGDQFDDLSPRREQLADLDTLLIDLADVGSRYYTFVWSALLAVRAASRAGVHCVILDRPNPIGGEVEGATQRSGFLSFVGLEPLPIRHALTLGELVAAFAARDGIGLGAEEALDVVPVRGWTRHAHADAWNRPFVMPSPNMPTLETARVYPGGCLLEGTNLSEGRGTTRPFELLGAPWLDGSRLADALAQLDLPGWVARPMTFLPTFQKHGGTLCGGIQVHITDIEQFRPVAVYTAIIALAARHHPNDFRFRTERYEFVDDIPAIDLLFGTPAIREGIVKGDDIMALADAASHVDDGYGAFHAEALERVRACEERR